MKKHRPSKILGIFSVVLGLWWLFEVFSPLLASLLFVPDFKWDSMYLFLFIWMSIWGVFLLVCGIKVLKESSKDSIKATVGSICLFAFIYTSARLGSYLENGIDGFPPDAIRIIEAVLNFILVLTAIYLYVLLSKYVISKEGDMPVKGEFIGKKIVFVISLSLANILYEIHHVYYFDWDVEYRLLPGILMLLSPFIFYGLGCRILYIQKHGLAKALR